MGCPLMCGWAPPPPDPTRRVPDFRIEKVRCPATVCLTDGRRLQGDLFLNPLSRFRPEPQEPVEFLNDEDRYFALAAPDGPALLVAKEAVAWIDVALAPAWAREESRVAVEVAMLEGEVRTGWLFPHPHPGRSRLLDYLNAEPAQFLPLAQEDRLTLVNHSALAHVREVG